MSPAIEQAGRGHAIEARRLQATLILLRTGSALALLGFVLGAIAVFMVARDADQRHAVAYIRAGTAQHLDPAAMLGIRPRPVPVTGIADSAKSIAATRLLWRMGVAGTMLAVLLGGGLTALLRRHWIATADAAALDQVLRGNRIATADELAKLVMKTKPQGSLLTIGGVPIPPEDEARHGLWVGSTGTGKTTGLHGLTRQIDDRGQCALIFDPDGSYVERFYRPERGDVILNVWDARSARWNPLADIAGIADAHRVAAILLPKPAQATESSIWYDQARIVVAHVLDHLAGTGNARLDDLAAMLAAASTDTLRTITAGTPAARVFEPGAERASASVLFMMTLAARTVTMLAAVPENAPPFSFDRFYAKLADQDGPRPFVFLAAPRRYRESGAPIIAAWIDAAASAILQRDPGDAPPAWLILDELASLPPIQSLLTLLPEGRKHRACTVIACQSIAQLRQTYGDRGTDIVTGQTATQLILRAGDHPTARWATELIGTVEVENRRANDTIGGKDDQASGSLATTRERKSLILDAEITGLRVGEAFLRLSGHPVAKVTIDPGAPMPVIAAAFVPAAAPPRVLTDNAATPPPTRIEDRADWLSMGGLL